MEGELITSYYTLIFQLATMFFVIFGSMKFFQRFFNGLV